LCPGTGTTAIVRLIAGQTWLAKGGAIAVANIRGGGEFGPAWHQAALNENRQRAFDDFQAVAADLIAHAADHAEATRHRRRLEWRVARQREHGGAARFVRAPSSASVPLIDMLRYTHFGAGASWVAEYGDPADPSARAWILKYSAYQNVKPDVKYPPCCSSPPPATTASRPSSRA
jgi:prolyl oligopeptidase